MSAAPLIDRGRALLGSRAPREAVECFRAALSIDPDSASAHFGLGVALLDLADLSGARNAFEQTVSREPRHAAALLNLGFIARRNGDFETAERCLRESLGIRPTHVPTLVNLGLVFLHRERFDEAVHSFATALALEPNQPEVRGRMGIALYHLGRIRESIPPLQFAVNHDGDAFAINALAMSTLALGEPVKAIEILRHGLSRFPDAIGVHSNLLVLMHFAPDVESQAIELETERWVSRHASALVAATDHANDPDPERRLRIGLVTPHVTSGPVPSVLEPLLTNHDRSALEFVLYANSTTSDGATERLRANVANWRTIADRPDDEVVRTIREDRIDVLIDLAGHTGGNRLLVFARKPAPVQATWLDYFDTTGLAAIDYVISDPAHTPLETAQHFVEQVVRLPVSRLCFRPPPADVRVSAPPSLTRGHFTFGSFNRLAKIHVRVIAAWSAILRAIPSARLVLKANEYFDPGVREIVRARFAAEGIAPDRLDVRGPDPYRTMLAQYADVDLALDPFPHNGGATTLDALWMGVPSLTVVGNSMIARQTHAMQSACGLSEFSVASPEALVPLARHWARNPEELTRLREGMRERVATSALCNGTAFARAMEAALRAMWRTWCMCRKKPVAATR